MCRVLGVWDLTGDLILIRGEEGLEGRIGNMNLKVLCLC